jgi:hypothetical protein
MTDASVMDSAAAVAEFRVDVRRSWERPAVAIVLTVMLYSAFVVLLGGRAHLGGDTGGRAAVLAAVDTGEHGRFDVGYWMTVDDPELLLHPLYYTQTLDGRAQQLSTLPMVLVARPLVAVGGERAALLLPTLGAIAAALGAAQLARRLGAPRPMTAYWMVAAASPITIYALDLWEHTLGLAFAMWAIVVLHTAERRPLAYGLIAGGLFGVGATMRTEVLVIGAIFGAAACVGLVVDGERTKAARLAVGGGLGAASAWMANDILERVVLGASLRSGRAGDVAGRAGTALSDRVDDAWVTLAGLNYADPSTDRLLGGAIVAALVLSAFFAIRGRQRLAVATVLIATVAFGIRLAAGLSFLPGLVAVFPIIAVGGVVGLADCRTRRLTLAALATLPAVWLTAYAGMPGAQWGGRYLFVSGCVLAVVALVPDVRPRFVRTTAIALGAVVTSTGLLYASVRSDEIERAQAAIDQYDQLDVDLIVSELPFLWRELGSHYKPDDPRLTVVDRAHYPTVATIATRRGFDAVVVLHESDRETPILSGYAVVVEDPFPWVGRNLTAALYVADETDDSDDSDVVPAR